MADDKEVLDPLDRYAKAIARNILRKRGLEYDRSRPEDTAQNVYIATWQVWEAKRNEGLASQTVAVG